MLPHTSTLAWKIPQMEEPGRLQSMGSQRVGHDWATSLSLFTFMHWRRKWQPTPVFLPGESQEQGSLLGCRLWGRTESDHDWSDLAAAAIYKIKCKLFTVACGVCLHFRPHCIFYASCDSFCLKSPPSLYQNPTPLSRPSLPAGLFHKAAADSLSLHQ